MGVTAMTLRHTWLAFARSRVCFLRRCSLVDSSARLWILGESVVVIVEEANERSEARALNFES